MTDDHEMRDGCKVMFDGIGKSLDGLRTEAKAREAAAEDRHAQVMQTFIGRPGRKGDSGLVGRVASLEQKDEERDKKDVQRKWLYRATLGVIAGLVTKAIHAWQTL